MEGRRADATGDADDNRGTDEFGAEERFIEVCLRQIRQSGKWTTMSSKSILYWPLLAAETSTMMGSPHTGFDYLPKFHRLQFLLGALLRVNSG